MLKAAVSPGHTVRFTGGTVTRTLLLTVKVALFVTGGAHAPLTTTA
jgi:hypothetical protein